MSKKIPIKTPEQIEKIRESALLVSKTLGVVAEKIDIGVTTRELDDLAREYIRDHGAEPGFLGLYGCPSSILASVNEAVVHGLPTERPLESGDIVTIDIGVLKGGWYGDHAYTFQLGDVKEETQKLCKVTLECLYLGIEKFQQGNRLGDIGFAIQSHAEKNGYSVVRDLVGHGIGETMHEAPEVHNYGKRGQGIVLKEGMVFAIEPMINMGTKRVRHLKDNWTIVTADNKPSAHYEHDVAILNGKPEILSTFSYVEEALKKKPHIC